MHSEHVKVKEILGWKKPGDLGIEIEVEFENQQSLNLDTGPPWSMKIDDSLRGAGYEFVTDKPISCDSTKKGLIKQITDQINRNKIVVDSPRTSVHVHVNILEHTPLQVWTAAATFWLLENVLIKYCGEEQRRGNLFCLRLKDAEGIFKQIFQDLRANLPFEHLRNDHIRYSNQNLNAITKFGSIEYRGMRGTTDPDIIDRWSTEVYNIVHKSKRFNDPSHMLDTYLNMNSGDFMDLVLSRVFVDELKTYKGWDQDIRENAGLLCEFAYFHEWDKWQERVDAKAKELGLIGRKEWGTPPIYRDHHDPVPTRAPPRVMPETASTRVNEFVNETRPATRTEMVQQRAWYNDLINTVNVVNVGVPTTNGN